MNETASGRLKKFCHEEGLQWLVIVLCATVFFLTSEYSIGSKSFWVLITILGAVCFIGGGAIIKLNRKRGTKLK